MICSNNLAIKQPQWILGVACTSFLSSCLSFFLIMRRAPLWTSSTVVYLALTNAKALVYLMIKQMERVWLQTIPTKHMWLLRLSKVDFAMLVWAWCINQLQSVLVTLPSVGCSWTHSFHRVVTCQTLMPVRYISWGNTRMLVLPADHSQPGHVCIYWLPIWEYKIPKLALEHQCITAPAWPSGLWQPVSTTWFGLVRWPTCSSLLNLTKEMTQDLIGREHHVLT